MGKLLIILSFISLVFLAVGTSIAPNSMMFWLASGSTSYQIVRGALALVLAIQIFTHPPRHIVFRLLAAGVAIAVASWTLRLSYSFLMPALDTFAFLSASIAVGIMALERRFVADEFVDAPNTGSAA